jgi:hypothetical protein
MTDLDNKASENLLRGSLSVRVGVIRDGTLGISLSMRTLSLTKDFKVAICAEDGERLYLFSVPGRTLSGEQLSDAEVKIDFEMKN